MKFFQFVKSKVFFIQILIAIILIILIIVVVMTSLSWYTEHDKTIEVPSLEGYKAEQIPTLVGKSELEFVISDSIYKQGAIPGAIVDQVPKAGSRVKAGRKIFLTINAYSREMVNMPQLVDYSLRNGKVVLETVGLRIGEITYKPSEYDGLVLAQLIGKEQVRPGTKVPKGTVVDLIVGSGVGDNSNIVPDLIGLTLQDAVTQIQSANFNLGVAIYDKSIVTPEDSLNAVVYRQNPEAVDGASEQAGTSINVWLTVDMDAVVAAVAREVVNDEEE